MKRSIRYIKKAAICLCIVAVLTQCSSQEELFDLADGNNVILALGWDGSTVKVISTEPDAEYLNIRDTGITYSPPPGSIKVSNSKTLWFFANSYLYYWKLSQNSTPTQSNVFVSIASWGMLEDGNVITQNDNELYSSSDGWSTIIATISNMLYFSSDLTCSGGGSNYLYDHNSNYIYTVTGSSATLYSMTGISNSAVYLGYRNGELFVGTIMGLSSDNYTNGTSFTQLFTGLGAVNTYSVSYAVINHDVQYVAYQVTTGSNIIVARIENSAATPVISIPDSGTAYVSLEHYRDNLFILGIGGSTSTAKGLYLVNADNNTYTLIDNSCEIYDLCRVNQ